MRYHKKVYFPTQDKDKLIALTYTLNRLQWQYSKHCIDNIKLKALDLSQLLYWIKNEAWLDYSQIFEYYIDKDIYKICYRVPYNKAVDIILVLTTNKKIVTIYYNSKDDKHYTLKKENYAKI